MSKCKFTIPKDDDLLNFSQKPAKTNGDKGSEIIKKIQSPKAGYIDEESLLPGTVEHNAEFTNQLEIPDINIASGHFEFKPLILQESLLNLNLRSHGTDLYYALCDNNRELVATKGANGPLVFKASLNDSGTYSFTLFDTLDRERLPNLIVNENFSTPQFEVEEAKDVNSLPGWELSHGPLNDKSISELHQKLETNSNQMYQVTFYYGNNRIGEVNNHPIDVYWNNDHLTRLDNTSIRSKGYTFSVLSNAEKFSQLRFVCADDSYIKNSLSNISVISRAQSSMPIVLAFILMGAEDIFEGDFKINITATPSLELNNHLPIDIVFDEENIYQTIVINDESMGDDPFAKINLDSIFETLSVEEDNRLVQIIQREQGGIPTNFYEVQVSSKGNDFSPITVADVQLSFPGGDAGVNVFFKNVSIDEV